VVHLAPAVVGPPPAGLLLRRLRGDLRRASRRSAAAPATVPLRQDEDVLDTWFSSALWPFATLGWPEQTPELAAFYPTDVLVTARDIIFLWVARMIMMGLEFTGECRSPTSTSLGHPGARRPPHVEVARHGIDPLEEIDKHGADAVRFGLLAMSSSAGRPLQRREGRAGRANSRTSCSTRRASCSPCASGERRDGGRRRRRRRSRTAGSSRAWRAIEQRALARAPRAL
jgi:hypothetical protein